MAVEVIQVDPSTLRIPPCRPYGADPGKLQLQISRFGRSLDGMPSLWVYRAADGELIIYNGVTRATRAAKLCPGQLVAVEVLGDIKRKGVTLPTIGEKLP
jgi:hypothetical protein